MLAPPIMFFCRLWLAEITYMEVAAEMKNLLLDLLDACVSLHLVSPLEQSSSEVFARVRLVRVWIFSIHRVRALRSLRTAAELLTGKTDGF